MASNTESYGAIKIFGYTVDILQKLGRGAFGTVFKGYDEAKDAIAVKKVAISNESEEKRKRTFSEAVKFHFLKDNVHNDHVIKVYDVKKWRDSMWIMMEFCDLGDLNNFFIKYHPKIDIKVKLNIMGQIAKGVTFLHSKHIVHRDIKPGNILLKSCNGCAIVKLGDFGLSKFLDPDGMTSSMSSDVGTVAFKALEFWDRKPNERVKYHRNVDVYAEGLVYAAMLQAKPRCTLVPKAEGSMQSFEKKMAIGFAAFTRCKDRHSKIKVVVPDVVNDTLLVKEIKSVVEAMTCFSPEARLTAEEVEGTIDSLARKFDRTAMNFISQFTVGEVDCPSQMCYVNSNLVLGFTPQTIRVYDEETGTVLNEWNSCHSFPTLMAFEMGGKQYLLEGCIDCKVIRGYESPETSSNYKTLHKDIVPGVMCQGPDSTVLLFEEKNSIKQIHFSGDRFNLIHKFPNELKNVVKMCYCDKYEIVVMAHTDQKTLTGVALVTGKIVWQHTKFQFGPPAQDLDQFTDVFTTPDGRICIFNWLELFVVDSKDGLIKYKLCDLEGPGSFLRIATRSIGFQHRFAFLCSPLKTQISLYDILPKRWLPLQNIIPQKEYLKTNE